VSPDVQDNRVVGYVRVSTDEQADSGAGLDAQRAAITAECQRRGWELVAIIADEGVSGGVPFAERPGGRQVLDLLGGRQAGGLMVAKLDRLTRSVPDAGNLLVLFSRKRWALALLDLGVDTSTPMGEAMANIAATFAQLERRLIGQRTREAMATIPRGPHVGKDGLPRSAIGRPVAIDPAVEARVVELRQLRVSLRAIADRMNAEAGVGPYGGRWHVSTVVRVLGRHAGEVPVIRPGRRRTARRQSRRARTATA
jgi:DNA invertase Pin-like site-specific DNA recombinase